jgi:hypothetical protein
MSRNIFQVGDAQAATKRVRGVGVREAEIIGDPFMAVRVKLNFTHEIRAVRPSR